MLAFISWYLIITILGWVTFPIAFRFFTHLPDRGYAFSKVLGLLLWGFGFWILASLQLLQNTVSAILVVFSILVLVSFLCNRKDKLTEVWIWIKTHWRYVLASETIFLAAFGFWTIIRALNPEIIGTEKPMELAFINAILRSPTFPPNDPWLSGYSISYYYFGYVIVAMIIKLSGVISGVGFNLAVALWFGLTAITAYGLLFNLISVWQKQGNSELGIGNIDKPPLLPALSGPFFILLVSNIEGFLEMLHSRGLFWKQTTEGIFQSRFWTWLNILELNKPPLQPFGWAPERASGIWWWRASRVVQDWDLLNNRQEVIDEFPFFSYLLADLHPHVLAMPFAILAIAVVLNLWLQIQDGWEGVTKISFQDWFKRWIAGDRISFLDTRLIARFKQGRLIIPILILGGLAFLNTWDLPIYVAFICAIWMLAEYRQNGWQIRLLADFVGLAIVYGLLAILCYLPFYIGFSSQAGGILPSMSFYTRGIHFWIMFAPLLIPIGIFVIWHFRKNWQNSSPDQAFKFAAIITGGLWVFSFILGWIGSRLTDWGTRLLEGSGSLSGSVLGEKLVTMGGLYANLQGSSDSSSLLLNALVRRMASPGTWLTLFLLILFIWAGLSIYKKAYSHNEVEQKPKKEITIYAFVLVMMLIGAGLTLVPEFIYLRDQFGSRMNTIFKFYFQTWIFWSLAAAFAIVVLFRSLSRIANWVFRIGINILLLLSLAYPFWGLWTKTEHFNFTKMTLDGNAYISQYNPGDWQAMEWLQKAPFGIIVEAVGGSYSAYGRFATQSGLPNVLGWPGHEGQWRGGWYDILSSREKDIETLYRTTDWLEAESVIDQYQIRYVIVSSYELSTYRPSLVKFDNFLKVAYQNESVTIYEVPITTEIGMQ